MQFNIDTNEAKDLANIILRAELPNVKLETVARIFVRERIFQLFGFNLISANIRVVATAINVVSLRPNKTIYF